MLNKSKFLAAAAFILTDLACSYGLGLPGILSLIAACTVAGWMSK